MCITFFCLQPSSHPRVKIVLGFNREEQTQRKTLPLHQFQDDKNIFAGRDLVSGGSWLGVNIQTGILVILTNYRLENRRIGISRGHLVHQFLKTSFIPPEQRGQTDEILFKQLSQTAKKAQQFSAFNLTLCNMRTRKTFYLCSQRNPLKNIPIELKLDETHGICNGDLEDIWPKTAFGTKLFREYVKDLGQMDQKGMLEGMSKIFKNNQKFSENEQEQSSIFVEPYFNTTHQTEKRTKTTLNLLLLENQNNYELVLKETTYHGKENSQSEVFLRIKMTK